MKSLTINKIYLFALFIMLISSCSGKKYKPTDGESIFSHQNDLMEDPKLIGVYADEPVILNNICFKTTDFEYENAGISMKSYPKIDKNDYKKFFLRNGDLDFYLHPIICENIIYDVKNDAEIVAYALDNQKVKKKWSKNLLTSKEKNNILVSNARLDDDILYVSTSNGYLIAFDVYKQKIIWKKKFDAIFSASPSINDDKLYIISTNNEVFAVNKNNGDTEWNFKGEKTITSSFQTPPVAIFNDKIVACFSNGEFVVLKNNGDILWQSKVFPANGANEDIMDIDFPPILVGNVLVVGGINTSVMGFDFKTGQPLWQIPTGLNSYMLYNSDGFGFFVNNHNENICFHTQTGSIKKIQSTDKNILINMPKYLNNGKKIKTQPIYRFFDSFF